MEATVKAMPELLATATTIIGAEGMSNIMSEAQKDIDKYARKKERELANMPRKENRKRFRKKEGQV